MATISADAIVATLIEFHSQRNTGKGGCTTTPSAVVTSKPSASLQCSRLTSRRISEPLAKLPGRSEIEITAASGNSVTTSNAMRKACAPSTRQRWFLPVTMAMVSALSCVAGRDAQVRERQQRDEEEDHRRDRRRQAEVLARVEEGDAVGVRDEDVGRARGDLGVEEVGPSVGQ